MTATTAENGNRRGDQRDATSAAPRAHKLLSLSAGVVTGLVLAGVSLWGCGSPSPAQLPAVSPSSGKDVNAPLKGLAPLSRQVTVEVVRGSLQAAAGGGALKTRRAGEALTEVTELRASGRGAVLSLRGGDGSSERGKLWLRGGARLRVGQTASGVARLVLEQGEARISLYDHRRRDVQLLRRGRFFDVAGEDLLLRSGAGALRVWRTTREPGLADWSLALLGEPAAAGIGTLAARGGVASLELRRVWVKVKPAGDVAATSVEHVFYNTSNERLEGTFRFPLPAGASLLGLAMEINGELMEGELVERHKARRTYESIVDAMQDPALLEWEQGNTFKLRVFPIEPRSEKRIVIRYLAPLRRTARGLMYVHGTAAPAMQSHTLDFRLDLDGKAVVRQGAFVPGQEVVVPAGKGAAAALRQVRDHGTYTALRVSTRGLLPTPKAPRAGLGKRPQPRDLLVVVDTSRSSLESRKLTLQAVRTLLSDLGKDDRFQVVAADLFARNHTPRLVRRTAGNQRSAVAFLQAVEPDGATDLGLALTHAGKLARAQRATNRRLQVVYLGDGTPTWGETEPAALRALAAQAMGRVPLHALVLGKGAHAELLEALVARLGGRAVRPRTMLGVRRFALSLRGAAGAPRLRQVTVDAGEADEIYPRGPVTLRAGDEHTVLIRTPPGKAAPATVTLRALRNGRAVTRRLKVKAADALHVAHRWARMHIAHLQAEGKPRDEVVKASLRHGVMSRHTAFLVLESEEAYKKYQIARRKKKEQQRIKLARLDPKVTGGDLESVGRRRASMSPDHMQPGDPEIRIPAPADARSVVVVFPFGETKVARYEPLLRAWTVRFLIGKDTAEGTYQVTVRVTHADGKVQLLPMSYVVDTTGPEIKVSVVKRGGRYVIRASQVVTRVMLGRELRRHEISGELKGAPRPEQLARYVELIKDAYRVDVVAPDGQAVRMWRRAEGEFRGNWRPRTPVTGPQVFSVVAVDKAYNRSVFSVTFDPQTGAVTRGSGS